MSAESSTVPIRVLIVDDEPLARTGMLALLGRDPEMQVVGECGSGEGAIGAIRTLRPDLVFLDVQMPECDGFEVLERLGADVPRAVVFVTAYDQYALRAFEAHALDYLLKPFDDARFDRTIERVKETLRDRGVRQDRIIVRAGSRLIVLEPREIDWIEAADYYAKLHVGGRSLLLRRSLSDLEAELDRSRFCRIHRSTIVNLERVREVRFDPRGNYEVALRDGTTLRLSRSYREALQTQLKTG